jgi:acetyl esterase/lipase
MKKNVLLAFFYVSTFVNAQNVIPLYNGKAPGSEKWTWNEKAKYYGMFQDTIVYNVAQPTLTAYLPDSTIANGTAVIICPGGAFHQLSIGSEGSWVAKWLNKKGVAAFVLRYRLVHCNTDDPVTETFSKMNDKSKLDKENDSVVTMAVADGKKAIEYVRMHAGAYRVNPKRIGIMGFSAGGTVTMGVGYTYSVANRPDFLAPVYFYRNALGPQTVPKDAPPIFICAASDDQLGFASHSSNLYNEWLAAGKSAELHIYSKGGHGFGMHKQGLPVDNWIESLGNWLDVQGLLKK